MVDLTQLMTPSEQADLNLNADKPMARLDMTRNYTIRRGPDTRSLPVHRTLTINRFGRAIVGRLWRAVHSTIDYYSYCTKPNKPVIHAALTLIL